MLNQDWSLGVELKGSILIPLFMWVYRRSRIGYAAIAAGLLLADPATGHYYVSFMLGVWLAFEEGLVGTLLAGQTKIVQIVWLVVGLLFYQTFNYYSRWHLGLAWTATAIGCWMILAAVLSSRRLQNILSSAPLVFLGRVSYSLYLLQFIVILGVLPPMMRWLNALGLTNQPGLFALITTLGTGLTLVLAKVSYELAEKPAIRLGHYLSAQLKGAAKH